ncbi:MAG: hypothetical protein WCO55_05600 [Candidatus Falkowbacteria bacterium]
MYDNFLDEIFGKHKQEILQEAGDNGPERLISTGLAQRLLSEVIEADLAESKKDMSMYFSILCSRVALARLAGETYRTHKLKELYTLCKVNLMPGNYAYKMAQKLIELMAKDELERKALGQELFDYCIARGYAKWAAELAPKYLGRRLYSRELNQMFKQFKSNDEKIDEIAEMMLKR